MRIFERNISRLRILLFSLESLLILGILYLIIFLRFVHVRGWDEYWLFDARQCIFKVLVIMVVCQACMYLNELYDYRVAKGRREFTIRLLQALGVACILLSILYLFFDSVSIGQVNFLIGLPTIILMLFLWRQLYLRILRSETFAEKILILGNSKTAKLIIDEISEVKDSGFEVAALAAEENYEELYAGNPLPVPLVLPLADFPRAVDALDVQRIVVAIFDRRGKLPFETLLNCRFKGIQVEEGTSFYEGLTGKIMLRDLRPSWFIFSEGFRKSKFTLTTKRLTDIVLAVVGLLLASPILFLFALLIKVDSRGPVIYKQDRVGEGWKEYTLYKFRSMVENAEAAGQAIWAEEDDPRVTRVGRIIRKYRIDELPQLFNVLKGDMSFVGPRPERRFFVVDLAKEIPYYPQRLFVKPGLTGWAQIKYHYGASRNETMEKLQYDLYYIKHMSFLFDLSIIFDTIRVVLMGKGAR